MGIVQFYETAIATRDEGVDIEFRYLCTPSRVIHSENQSLLDPRNPSPLLSALGAAEHVPLRIAELPNAILTALQGGVIRISNVPNESWLSNVRNESWLQDQRTARPDLAFFAEYLATAEVVPFDASPISGYSLMSLGMKSGLKALGVDQLAPHILQVGA